MHGCFDLQIAVFVAYEMLFHLIYKLWDMFKDGFFNPLTFDLSKMAAWIFLIFFPNTN